MQNCSNLAGEGVSNRGPTWPPVASTTPIRDRGISVTTWGSETSRKYRCSRRQLCWPEVPVTLIPLVGGGGLEVGREVARLALKEKRG